MSSKKQRKRKSSDKDIKAFFNDYHKAKARIRRLVSLTISRPLTKEEEKEKYNLELFIECIDEIVASLDPLMSQIIEDCYINQKTLFNISLELNYCYEHVSYLKNIGCNVLRKILSGKDVIQNEYSINVNTIIKNIVNEKENV